MISLNDRICVNCDSNVTYIHKNGCEAWHKYIGGYICHKCYNRLVLNPRWNYINSRRWSKKRLVFKGKQLYLEEKTLKGICDICKRKIGDEYIDYDGNISKIRQTHLHHIKYHDDDPLKDTIELCVSCHMKETHKLKNLIT